MPLNIKTRVVSVKDPQTGQFKSFDAIGGSVISVNGETGTVSLDAGDINVDDSAQNPVTVASELSGINSAIKDVQDSKADVIIGSASGNIASFADGADNMPLNDCMVQIEPVQSGSGDPAPDNVRPITGWTGVNVYRTGKNLFQQAEISLGKPGNRTASIYFDTPIKPGSYVVSYVQSGTYTGGNSNYGIQAFNGSTNVGNVNLSTGVLTISEEAKRLYFYMSNGNYDDNETLILSNFQLELGSTATTYEPYSGAAYPISWQTEAGTVYGGSLDVTTGLLTVDKAFFSEPVSEMNQADDNFPGWKNKGWKQVLGYNDNGALTTGVYGNVGTKVSYNFSGSNDIVFLPKTIYTMTQTEWMTNYPNLVVQFVLPLANPQTYQLTATEVKTLLGQNNIWADTGAVNVNYPADTTKTIDDVYSALSDKYEKPSTGIPASDLASGVIPDVSGKQDAPSTTGTAGQVLGLDNNLNPVWVDQSGSGGNLPTEETGQELLAQETYNTGLTDTTLSVIGMLFTNLPQDETLELILESITLECERLDTIYAGWLAERESA